MFDFIYNIDFEKLGVPSAVFVTVFTVFISAAALYFAIWAALYILRAIGLYKMAATANIANSFVAFIPIVNVYTLGKVSEKYKSKNNNVKYGVILLVLRAASFLIGLAAVITLILSMKIIFEYASQAVASNTEMTLEMLSSVTVPIILFSILMLVSLAFIIVRYFALWKIYSAFDNRYAVVYMVFSVLFNFLDPIFIFALRKKQPVFEPTVYY